MKLHCYCNNNSILLFPPKPTFHIHHHNHLTLTPKFSFPLLKTSSGCRRNRSTACRSGEFWVSPELGRLLSLLPGQMRQRLGQHLELHQLIEVVMDLGRNPLARFPTGDFVLSDLPITAQDLEFAVSQVGDFAIDNRAGISRTLHRISAIRNRKGEVVGLTCRVGRAITGSANLLISLVADGSSLLLIGPPGVGKTTIIREIARMLAYNFKRRVMIVDTSNEISGDGDIPHEGIGSARRMQVPNSAMQHEVLIEAVENHMPQVIVIDEISTKLEAMAASTIAQRGIQLVATAHGTTIRNLINNPALDMLVGGIQSVTLGDEEANRRQVQKSILERKGPATFSCAVEIVSKKELRVHRSLETTVDAILAGRPPNVEVRKIKSNDSTETLESEPFVFDSPETEEEPVDDEIPDPVENGTFYSDDASMVSTTTSILDESAEDTIHVRLFLYGILEASVTQAIKQLKMDNSAICLTNNISESDALLGLQSKLKKNPGIQAAARSHNIPVYMIKTSSLVQIRMVVREIVGDYKDGLKDFGLDKVKSSELTDALEEVRLAIEQVVIPKGEPAELLPRSLRVMSLQLNLIKKYELDAERIGSGAIARLRILPFGARINDNDDDTDDDILEGTEFDDFGNGNANGYAHIVERLPLLPE